MAKLNEPCNIFEYRNAKVEQDELRLHLKREEEVKEQWSIEEEDLCQFVLVGLYNLRVDGEKEHFPKKSEGLFD